MAWAGPGVASAFPDVQTEVLNIGGRVGGSVFESRRPAYQASLRGPWKPLATYGLLGVIGAFFVVELALLSRPALFDALFVIDTDWPARPWSLATSTLSHGSPQHLLLNGLFLYFFGPVVERIVGRRRFLALFFVAGALSGVTQVHLSAALGHPNGALGASGALMMLFGVVMVLLPREKILIYGIVPVPMWAAGIGYAALDILGALNPSSPIGNFAHLSGMALGLGYGAWLKGDFRKRGLRLVQA